MVSDSWQDFSISWSVYAVGPGSASRPGIHLSTTSFVLVAFVSRGAAYANSNSVIVLL
jgi:hypothetical protein